jgi:hypothetical protein
MKGKTKNTKSQRLSIKSIKKKTKKNNRKYNKKGGGFDDNDIDIFIKDKINKKIYDLLQKSKFYKEDYCTIINGKIQEKILKQTKPLININNTRVKVVVKYLAEPFHNETKTPMDYYKWWSSKLNRYGNQSKNWVIFDELIFFYVNQLSRIINSYLKYTAGDKKFEDIIKLYLNNLDEFKKHKTYEYIYNIQISYINWYNNRIEKYQNDGCDSIISNFKNNFTKSLDNPYLFWPLSFVPSPEKFIRYFACPLIPFIGVNKRVHGNLNHPCWQINHDISLHGPYFAKEYYTIKNPDTPTDIKTFKKVYFEKAEILDNIYKLENKVIPRLLFVLIHEISDFIIRIIDMEDSKTREKYLTIRDEIHWFPRTIKILEEILKEENYKLTLSGRNIMEILFLDLHYNLSIEEFKTLCKTLLTELKKGSTPESFENAENSIYQDNLSNNEFFAKISKKT